MANDVEIFIKYITDVADKYEKIRKKVSPEVAEAILHVHVELDELHQSIRNGETQQTIKEEMADVIGVVFELSRVLGISETDLIRAILNKCVIVNLRVKESEVK